MTEITGIPKTVFISVGDVIMKDFLVIKPTEAKEKINDVFGVVFHVTESKIKFMSIEYPCHPCQFKIKETPETKYLPLYYSGNDAVGDVNGNINTEIIISANNFSKETYPALKYCMNYNKFGFDKGRWYLPSISELNLI